jgi:hypothetical protein
LSFSAAFSFSISAKVKTLSLTGGGNEPDLLAADITQVSTKIARALRATVFIVGPIRRLARAQVNFAG